MNQQDFIDQLISTPPLEEARADTQLRYSYQKNWGFLKILELIDQERSFVIAFEYMEDILLIEDDVVSPKKIEYYQVKTQKGGVKKISTLLSRTATKPSAVEKICSHKFRFKQPKSKSFIFVSNVPFDGINDKNLGADKLNAKVKKSILATLRLSFPKITEDFLSEIYFHQSDLQLDSQEQLINGMVHDLFLKRFGGNTEILHAVPTWARDIRDTILRKSEVKASQVKNSRDFLKLKCLAVAQIYQSLDDIQELAGKRFSWELIQEELRNHDIPYIECVKIKKAWDKLNVDRFDSNLMLLKKLMKHAEKQLNSIDLTQLTLTQALDLVLPSMYKYSSKAYSDEYLKAIVLRCYHEAI